MIVSVKSRKDFYPLMLGGTLYDLIDIIYEEDPNNFEKSIKKYFGKDFYNKFLDEMKIALNKPAKRKLTGKNIIINALSSAIKKKTKTDRVPRSIAAYDWLDDDEFESTHELISKKGTVKSDPSYYSKGYKKDLRTYAKEYMIGEFPISKKNFTMKDYEYIDSIYPRSRS